MRSLCCFRTLGLALALPLLAAVLSSCETIPPAACPPVKDYTKAEQAKAKAEVDVLAPAAILRTFIDDYKMLRDAAHACRGDDALLR